MPGAAGAGIEPRLEFGALFRDLRQALGVSIPVLAERVGTRIEVIRALEAGDTLALPPWPETVRVVSVILQAINVDPRPVLLSIRWDMDRLAQMEVAGGHVDAPRVGLLAPVWALTAWVRARVPVNGRRAAGIALALFVFATLFAQASTLQASFATLEPPITRLMRSAQDYLLARAAPVRDGLRWIHVDDPRTRRGDKLHQPARAP